MTTPSAGNLASDDSLHRRIVEETQEAVIFADAGGVIRLWNAGAERVFGWTAAEALGQSLDLIIPEKLRGRHWDGWKQVMETGVTRYATDLLAVPGVRKDGSRISLEFTVALIRDDAGAIAGVAAVLRDVTERWQRDKELRARLAELESKRVG
jgi:PAS domain S-box-containing protein